MTTAEETSVQAPAVPVATDASVLPAKESAKEVLAAALEVAPVAEPMAVDAAVEEPVEDEAQEDDEEEESPVTLEQVPELVANGTQLFALGNYETAVEKLAVAVETLYEVALL
jgi:hypothetical protein